MQVVDLLKHVFLWKTKPLYRKKNMSIETFRIFCDVVRYQSFSQGATANKVSQSAATQSIHRLEKEIGTELIDRSKRPFVLTPDGKICYECMREILENYDNMVMNIRALHDQVGGLIRVAAIYSVGLHDMSRCMGNFMKTYPQSNIRLEFLPPHKVYDTVLKGEVDIGIVSYPQGSPDINVIPLRSEDMVLVVPAGHPLASKKEIELSELQNVDFIGFSHELPIRKELDKAMRQNGIHVNIKMEFDNIETIKQAISVDLGVSILPAPTVAIEVTDGRMVAIPLINPKMRRPIGIIHQHRKTFTSTMLMFIDMLKDTLLG